MRKEMEERYKQIYSELRAEAENYDTSKFDLTRKGKGKDNISEVGLCKILKNSNLFPGFILHEEVGIAGYYCDMVYENGSQVFTIEVKTELNYSVFAQACRWRSVSTASYVAVPMYAVKKWRHNPKKVILEELGLGLIVMDNNGAVFGRGYSPFEQKDIAPGSNEGITLFPADMEFWKPCFERIGESLIPAGSSWGRRSTTFSRTIDALRLAAKEHPDYSLRQLLEIVPTHYSSINTASACIRDYFRCGVIEKFWHEEPPR